MKVHLMEGKDTDSGYLTIDQILYIPNFFSIINTSSNHPPNLRHNCFSVRVRYGLAGRDDLPHNLEFFEHIIKVGAEGGYNDSIRYLEEIDFPVTEEELIDAMKDTHLVTSEEAHEAYTEYSRKTHELWERVQNLDLFEKIREEEIRPEYELKTTGRISPKLQQWVERAKPFLGNNEVPPVEELVHADSI